jgi:hypothetical protein
MQSDNATEPWRHRGRGGGRPPSGEGRPIGGDRLVAEGESVIE